MTDSTPPPLVSMGRRVSMLAHEHPEGVAMTFVNRAGGARDISWAELDEETNRLARLLAERDVDEQATVVIGLPNCPEHVMTAIGAWKLGAMVLPLSARLPKAERDAILELARPSAVIADWDQPGVLGPSRLSESRSLSSEALPDKVPHPGKAIASGGSTGRPKIIVDPNPYGASPETLDAMLREWAGIGGREVQLVAGPLYHNSPFSWAFLGLFLDHRLILMEHFDAETAVRLIEHHRVSFFPAVPTMMQRMLRLPDIANRDLSSVSSVFHTAAPCPAWAKRGWIELVGGEKVFELFGSTEGMGACTIRGDEWLDHPGSVGRPTATTELQILGEGGEELPCGEVGEIFMRWSDRSDPTYHYVGSPPATTTSTGFVSVGDLGWVDQDGYLFIADRRVDLIISGGANVYPAEVELALAEHPEVVDVAVIGLPSDDWGRQVHAIIQPAHPTEPPTTDDLDRHCREFLAAYKIPKSYEFVSELPRNEAGKIRRSALVAERTQLEPSAVSGGT